MKKLLLAIVLGIALFKWAAPYMTPSDVPVLLPYEVREELYREASK